MTIPLNRRAFLPACLTLGALLGSLPVLAGVPAMPPAAGAAKVQTLALQNTVPGDILKVMHWDRAAHLPAGVTRISAHPATNSLAVVATPAGFAKVRDLVRLLDIVQRQAVIKFATAYAAEADLKASGINFDLVPAPDLGRAAFLRYGAGGDAAALLQALTKRGATTSAPIITTTNNVAATISVETTISPRLVSSATLAVTPRINSDDSVTLDLHSTFRDGAAKREIKTLRTVKSGDTLVIVMPPTDTTGKNFLLFVTPTIPLTGQGQAVMTVK